jgi:hypothetical protein
MEMNGQLHAPPSGNVFGIHWMGHWVDCSVGLDAVERKKSCSDGSRNRVLQYVVRTYIDCAPRLISKTLTNIDYREQFLAPSALSLGKMIFRTQWINCRIHIGYNSGRAESCLPKIESQ